MEDRCLYEIHLTVKDTDALKLMDFVRTGSLKYILVYNPVGQYMVQPMISKFKNGTFQEIYDRAKILKQQMQDFGIEVVRSKIEAMASSSVVPKSDLELQQFLIEKQKLGFTDRPYVEFHIKTTTTTYTTEQVHKLCQSFSTDNVRVGASVNLAGAKKQILITIRCFDMHYLNAEQHKNGILDQLKEQNLMFDGPLQQEFSVYDDHVELDEDWL